MEDADLNFKKDSKTKLYQSNMSNMFKYPEEGISTLIAILIIVLIVIAVGQGILIWRYEQRYKEKSIPEKNEICFPFPKSAEKIDATIEQKVVQLLLQPDEFMISDDELVPAVPAVFANPGVLFGELVDLSDPTKYKMAENDTVRIAHLDLIKKFLEKYKRLKGYYPKTNESTFNISMVTSAYKELVKYVPEAFFMPHDPLESQGYQYKSDGETFALVAVPEIQDPRNEPASYFNHCAKNQKVGEQHYIYICEGE